MVDITAKLFWYRSKEWWAAMADKLNDIVYTDESKETINVINLLLLGWILLGLVVYIIGNVIATYLRKRKSLVSRSKPETPTTAADDSVPCASTNDVQESFGDISECTSQTIIPTCEGDDEEFVKWINGVIYWIYTQRVVSPAIDSWLTALNARTRLSSTEHGILVDFRDLLHTSGSPKVTEVRQTSRYDDTGVTCDMEFENIAFELVVTQFREKEKIILPFVLKVRRLFGKVSIECNPEDVSFVAKYSEPPQIDMHPEASNDVQVLPEDYAPLCDVVSEIANDALTHAIVPLRLSCFPDCPRIHTTEDVFEAAESGSEKRLLVKVVKATNLGGSRGCLKPYCVVEMDDPPQRFETQVVEGTNSPFWDEGFTFSVKDPAELLFEIYDKDQTTSESRGFLGLGIVGVDELVRNPSQRQIIPLQSRPLEEDDVTGALTVEFLFLDRTSPVLESTRFGPPLPNDIGKSVETNSRVTAGGTVITTTTIKRTKEECSAHTEEPMPNPKASSNPNLHATEEMLHPETPNSLDMKENRKSHTESTNDLTESSNDLTENSNDLAENSNDFAENSNDLAENSNDLAENSNDLDENSNELAENSNDLAENSEGLVESEIKLVENSKGLTRCTNKIAECSKDLALSSTQEKSMQNVVEPESRVAGQPSNLPSDDLAVDLLAQKSEQKLESSTQNGTKKLDSKFVDQKTDPPILINVGTADLHARIIDQIVDSPAQKDQKLEIINDSLVENGDIKVKSHVNQYVIQNSDLTSHTDQYVVQNSDLLSQNGYSKHEYNNSSDLNAISNSVFVERKAVNGSVHVNGSEVSKTVNKSVPVIIPPQPPAILVGGHSDALKDVQPIAEDGESLNTVEKSMGGAEEADLAGTAIQQLGKQQSTPSSTSKSTLIIHSVQRPENSVSGSMDVSPGHLSNSYSDPSSPTHESQEEGEDDRGRPKEKRSFMGNLRRRLSFHRGRSKSTEAGPTPDQSRASSRSVSTDRIRHTPTPVRMSPFKGRFLGSTRSSLSEASGISASSAKTYIHENSTLVIETNENGIVKRYLIPNSLVQRSKLKKRGTKLHIYNDHVFIAKHLSGSTQCQVCRRHLTRRPGKQGYECRGCDLQCHKSCHVKVENYCSNSSINSMEVEYIHDPKGASPKSI